MLRLLTYIFIIIVLVCGGLYLAHLSGYALIVLPQWTLETPIWVAAFSILIVFIILYFIARLLRVLLTLQRRLKKLAELKKIREAQHALEQGTLALLSLQLDPAKLKFQQASVAHPQPFLTQLGLVLVAHEQGDIAVRDELVKQIQTQYPSSQFPVGILQARLLLNAGNAEAAITTLLTLYNYNPAHSAVLALLAESYYQEKNPAELKKLLPALQRSQAVTQDTYYRYLSVITVDNILHAQNLTVLLAIWHETVSRVRQNFAVLQAYVQQLLHYHLPQEAEIITRAQIEQQATDELYSLYASINADEHQQILQVEAWLKHEPYNAVLLFAAGQLCLRYKLWGKAKDYFLLSSQQHANPKVYLALAKLFEQLDDKEKAAQYYRDGLILIGSA